MSDEPSIIVPVGVCDWCWREAVHRVGPWVACLVHADSRVGPGRPAVYPVGADTQGAREGGTMGDVMVPSGRSLPLPPEGEAGWERGDRVMGALRRVVELVRDGWGHPVEVGRSMGTGRDRQWLRTSRLWMITDAGMLIPDYLDYNPSRADNEQRRKRDAERKRRGRSNTGRDPQNGQFTSLAATTHSTDVTP